MRGAKPAWPMITGDGWPGPGCTTSRNEIVLSGAFLTQILPPHASRSVAATSSFAAASTNNCSRAAAAARCVAPPERKVVRLA